MPKTPDTLFCLSCEESHESKTEGTGSTLHVLCLECDDKVRREMKAIYLEK